MSILQLRKSLFGSRRRAAVTASLLSVTVVVFFWFRPENPPPLVFYPKPFDFPKTTEPIPIRWIPKTQNWAELRKLCDTFRPKKKPILNDLMFVEVPASYRMGSGSGESILHTNGVAIWCLPYQDEARVWIQPGVTDSISVLSRPTIAVAPGRDVGSLSMGESRPYSCECSTSFGLEDLRHLHYTLIRLVDLLHEKRVEFFEKRRGYGGMEIRFTNQLRNGATDLKANVLATWTSGLSATSTRTNLNFSFRAQIPPGGSMFMLTDFNPLNKNGHNRLAVLWTPRTPDSPAAASAW